MNDSPASHGFALPPGTSTHISPSANVGSPVPYSPQGPSPSANDVCGSSSASPVNATSSRQNVHASGVNPPSWNAICPSGSPSPGVAGYDAFAVKTSSTGVGAEVSAGLVSRTVPYGAPFWPTSARIVTSVDALAV